MESKRRTRLGELLIEYGKITPEQLVTALFVQRDKNEKLGQILLQLGFIDEKGLYMTLGDKWGIPWIDLSETEIEQAAVCQIHEDFASANNLIAFKKKWNQLHVAMADPMDLFVIDDLETITKYSIVAYFASPKEISEALSIHYRQESTHTEKADLNQILNTIIPQAVQEKASGIHTTQGKGNLQISFQAGDEMYEISVVKKAVDCQSEEL